MGAGFLTSCSLWREITEQWNGSLAQTFRLKRPNTRGKLILPLLALLMRCAGALVKKIRDQQTGVIRSQVAHEFRIRR